MATKYTGSNLERVIQQLLDAIRADALTPYDLPLVMGTDEVRRFDTPPRITFTPLYDDGYADPHEQPDDGHACYETTTYCQVECWGNDYSDAMRLRDVLLRQGWSTLTPNAFKTPKGKAQYSKGLGTEKGQKITFTVGFNIPIYDEVFIQGHIATFTPTLAVDDPDGTNPEDIPQ